MPSLLLPNGQPATPASLEKAASEPDTTPAPVECVTAMIIYTLPDGRTMVSDDLDYPLVPGRKPTRDEIFAMASIVVKDVVNTDAAELTANATVGLQEMRMQQAMQRQQAAMVQAKLEQEEQARRQRR